MNTRNVSTSAQTSKSEEKVSKASKGASEGVISIKDVESWRVFDAVRDLTNNY